MQTKEELFGQLKQVVIMETFSGYEVQKESNFKDDLDLDSLDKVELLMECETRFQINIDDEEYEEIETVNDLLENIYRKLK